MLFRTLRTAEKTSPAPRGFSPKQGGIVANLPERVQSGVSRVCSIGGCRKQLCCFSTGPKNRLRRGTSRLPSSLQLRVTPPHAVRARPDGTCPARAAAALTATALRATVIVYVPPMPRRRTRVVSDADHQLFPHGGPAETEQGEVIMSPLSEKIWFDGKMVPEDEAKVSVLSHALHYGTAVFEGIRAYRSPDGTSAIFRLPDHVKRLFNSAKILGLHIPHSEETITAAVIDTLKANKLDEGYIRPLSFVGDGGLGVYPGNNPVRTIIAAWSWGAYLGPEALENGIRVKTSSFTRHHVNAMMSKAKAAGNYVNSVLAKVEVKADGYDEALMLDTNGFVSEATGENMFIVRRGVIKTTPLTSILEGITRDSVMTLARDLGYEVQEQLFTRDEVYCADEAFFSGTAAEVTPIREVDGRVIGAGKAGPVAKALQAAFFKAAKGQDPAYGHWLTTYTL